MSTYENINLNYHAGETTNPIIMTLAVITKLFPFVKEEMNDRTYKAADALMKAAESKDIPFSFTAELGAMLNFFTTVIVDVYQNLGGMAVMETMKAALELASKGLATQGMDLTVDVSSDTVDLNEQIDQMIRREAEKAGMKVNEHPSDADEEGKGD